MEAIIAWCVANPAAATAIATGGVALFVAIAKVTKNKTDDKVAGVLTKILAAFTSKKK